MRRTLFEQYEIEEQNHDFLVSKKSFTDAFKEYIFSEIFVDKISQVKKEELTEKIVVATDNTEISYTVVTFKIIEITQNNIVTSKILEIYYSPKLPFATYEKKILFYKIELVVADENGSVYFDMDAILFAVKKRLRKNKIENNLQSSFSLKHNRYTAPFHNNNIEVNYNSIVMMTEQSWIDMFILKENILDLVWDLIKMLEDDFFRTVDKKDITT